jgi:hypothetical protein
VVILRLKREVPAVGHFGLSGFPSERMPVWRRETDEIDTVSAPNDCDPYASILSVSENRDGDAVRTTYAKSNLDRGCQQAQQGILLELVGEYFQQTRRSWANQNWLS